MARVVRGVRVGPSPDWLAQKLEAAGQRPINVIVDVTNLVMLEWGSQLDAPVSRQVAAIAGMQRSVVRDVLSALLTDESGNPVHADGTLIDAQA